jgi:hypothetical protein
MTTLEKIITLFDKNPHKSNTFSVFYNNAKVRSGKNLIPLSEYVERKKIDLDNVLLLHEHIKHRNVYLTNFYNSSIKYPESLRITESPATKTKMDNNQNIKYKNVIRNLFFIEILKNTKSGMENVPTFLDVLDELYNKWIIDYKILAPSSIHYLQEGHISSVFSSLYFRASIMNPYLVYSINKSILGNAESVFTPTLGWGSYYYGFAESGIKTYVGTDVIPNVCKKVGDFAKKHYPQIETNILCSPSETLNENPAFLRKYRESFDCVFFSPPYFKLELYPGKKQSTTLYDDYETWLREYWEKTIVLCKKVLKKGGVLCYILSGYGGSSDFINLLENMNNITKKHFLLKKIYPMFNKNVHVTMHRDTDEKIMVFH